MKKNLSLTPGAFLTVLALGGCALSACHIAPKPCTEAAIQGIKLCMPQEYLRVSNRPEGKPMAFHIRVPVKVLPIIPDDPGYGEVMVDLYEEFETFADRQARAIESYKTAYRQPIHEHQENGLTVLTTTTPYPTTPVYDDFGSDILFPANGDQAYFLCSRRRLNRDGEIVETLCGVNVDWDANLPRPRVRLEFHMRRIDIAHWKETEARVRAFLKVYTINSTSN